MNGARIKEAWACSIIAQALCDIKTMKDTPIILEKVGRTALGVRPDLMKEFKRLVEAKRKTLR